MVCNQLQVTPLDEQVKRSIHQHHQIKRTEEALASKADELVHPDFDSLRSLLPQELKPFGVKVLREGQEVARDVNIYIMVYREDAFQ